MKILLYLLSLIIITAVAVLAAVNAHSTIGLILKGTFNVNVAGLIFAVFVAGLIAGGLFVVAWTIKTKKTLNEYKRQLEKTSVNAECDSSKVKVLESKIEVLEKALASALEKNKDN
jgi:uncharacterized membrane protein YciS (DUF1049 family)